MRFRVELGVAVGWRLRFGATGSASIDQYGRYRGLGAQGEEYRSFPSDLSERLREAVEREVAARKARGERVRYHSCFAEKRAFLEAVADRLNKGEPS